MEIKKNPIGRPKKGIEVIKEKRRNNPGRPPIDDLKQAVTVCVKTSVIDKIGGRNKVKEFLLNAINKFIK